MALSPEAAKSLTPKEIEEIAALEAKIDLFLQSEHGRESGTFPYFEMNTSNQRIVSELIARYKRAGWKDVRVNSGRDGSGLQFYDKKITW